MGATPLVVKETIEVEMADNSTYRGTITSDHWLLPSWLNHRGVEHNKKYGVFIRLPFNDFDSELVPFRLLPGHNLRTHGPTFAQIRFKDFEYYTASNFQLFHVHEVHLDDLDNYAPDNHIYITMPGGPVYSARLNRPFHIDAVNFGANQ